MAFRATLTFEGNKYDVLDCNYSFDRDIDLKGRPSSHVYGGAIRIEVESTDCTKIFAQMVNQFAPNSGSIVFNKGDEESTLKELTWENGYIIDFIEVLDVIGREPMKIVFVVSAEKVALNGVEVDQQWP